MTPRTEENAPASPWRQTWFLCLLLIAATLITYQPAWNGSPVWDDEQHLTSPELYSLQGLQKIWTQPGATQQYYPLVHTLFWVEYKLWNYRPAGYHFINILLHAGSALLLLSILRTLGLELRTAWLAAAIFALHPVEVESVAWISEVKNTLSGTFYLGAALVYLHYDSHRTKTLYFPAFLLFVMGLLSKTVVASLPAALLVVFWWKRGRLSWKRDAMPLIPFFAVGILSGLFTAWVEKKYIGATGAAFGYSGVERILIAGRAFWFYLGKVFWPANLIFIYPRWTVNVSEWWQYLFPALAALLLLALWMVRKRTRGPLAAMLFFGGTLFPALGFFNVYPFLFSFVADHFQYLASIGPITLGAAGITFLADRVKTKSPALKPAFCGALMLLLAVLTWRQSRIFADNETLWQTTVTKNPGSWLAHDNFGMALLQNAKVDAAVDELRRALILRPDSDETYSNLGSALLQSGQIDEAIENYEKSLALNPRNQGSHYNLGTVLLHQKRQYDDAIFHLEKSIEIDRSMGRPENFYAHYDLGVAYFKKGEFKAAVTHYQKALESLPKFPEAQAGLAWILATCPDASVRDGRQAVVMAGSANEARGGQNPEILKILAASYAEAGQFKEAVTAAHQALAIATMTHDSVLIGTIEDQLALYQAGKPFHEDKNQ